MSRFEDEHGDDEERRGTLGCTFNGQLLLIVHIHLSTTCPAVLHCTGSLPTRQLFSVRQA